MLKTLLNNHIDTLSGLPGEHFEGKITGDCEEWRTELTIDYYMSDEDTEAENSYFLVFALFEIDGQVKAELSLNHYVNEVGVNDKFSFPLEAPDTWLANLQSHADDWDMHKDAFGIGSELLTKIQSLMVALNQEPNFSIT